VEDTDLNKNLRLSRLIRALEGLVHYGNPWHVALKRAFAKTGLMTISDRQSGVTVTASVKSSHMFSSTWFSRDYDVPSCPLRAGDWVVDIGANQGFFSCYAASKGASVHAFEPTPESFGRLRANVERNGYSSSVKVFQKAVSRSTGVAHLWCSDYLGGGSNTIVENHLAAIPEEIEGKIEVDTVAIDSVLAEIPGRIRLCKIDCEGAEYEILSALSDSSRIDSLAIEFHPCAYRLRDFVAIIMNWGTHQVSFGRENHMLYAVRNEILSEYADTQS
jgi:FkbM family methyltransferase